MTTTSVALEELVDPAYREALASMPARVADLHDIAGSVAAIREAGAKRAAAAPQPDRSGVRVEDHLVPGPPGHPDVMVRVYRPDALPANAPAVYNIHGGGMIAGNVPQSDPDCLAYAKNLNVLVASVEYRLAPEHPHPAPVEDCYAGLQWLWDQVGAFGLNRDRIAIRGGSAGGGLAAGLALLARDRDEVSICFQNLIFPMIDDRNVTPSSYAITDGRVWNRDLNTLGWNAYLAGRAGADDVSIYAAPARATDLRGLPPAYISVGTLDLFLDEDVEYARTLWQAGVPTELHIYPGAFHGAHSFIPTAPLSRRWRKDEYEAMERALHG